MFIIRPMTIDDKEGFIKMAFTAKLGMTSLPKDKEILSRYVEKAVQSFQKSVKSPGNEGYYFILEDIEKGEVIGVSAIIAELGHERPLYLYKIGKGHLIPHILKKGPSEICSLYLKPDARKHGLGRLLSFSRFLFMANRRAGFHKSVFAVMRGFFSVNTMSCPFWSEVGEPFFKMNFKEVMEKNDISDDFIAALLPKKPIPITDTIRPLLGQVHPNTEPALNMLKEEGFEFTHEIDILDGGPRIECKIDKIKTIVNSEIITVYDFLDSQPEKTEFLISTVSNDFRVCLGNAYGGLIDKTTAALLNIKKGDAVRIAPLHNKI